MAKFAYDSLKLRRVAILSSASSAQSVGLAKYFHAMLEEGIYLAPSQFEAGFLSTAHTEADLEKTVRAAAAAMKALNR